MEPKYPEALLLTVIGELYVQNCLFKQQIELSGREVNDENSGANITTHEESGREDGANITEDQ